MSEIYPKISEGVIKPSESEAFRLQKVNEINSYFEKEIENQLKIVKKLKKIYSVFYVLNIGSSISSLALGMGGLGLFVTAILPPVAITLGGVTVGIGFSMLVFDIINKKLMHKIGKHKEIIGCAEGTLKTVHVIYSKALEDGKIDHDEFKLILSEKDKYIELKNQIRQKSFDTEQKINEEIKKKILEEGRQLGIKELMEKLKGPV